ncbi:ionotropic receptor 75a-like [Belonocnema kinseyi]|uniref:ionotropic receptor 75a-like n=1 Tax=Belonocnema kinseyi TaxID=2817044 RepID=UPI00143DF374|nr:ionotropic receptor 75a-like [Belonocnema kinseyi]
MTVALRKNNSYIMYDVYNHSYRHGGKINVTYMGSWNKKNGLEISLNQYKYKRRADFHGLSLNFSVAYTSTPIPDLETYMTTSVNPDRDSLSRFHYALVQQLKDMYNFTIHMTKAKTWGYIVNGSFNGILGDMLNGIVDISAAPFLYSLERIDVCEWTVQTYFARPVLMFRHPKKNAIHIVFLKPFSKEVWWAIMIFGIIYWTILLCMLKIEIKTKSQSRMRSLRSTPIPGAAFIVCGALTQQGSCEVPRFCSSRILFLSLYVWGLLTYQFYSASIVGSLLAESPHFINTVHDLLATNMEVGIEDVGYNHNFLRTPPDDRCRALKKRVQENTKKGKTTFLNGTEGIRRMQKGDFAFLVDVATAYRIIEETFADNEICDLVEIQAYDASDLGLVTSKHSPFKKMVIYGLRQTVTSGIAKRHRTIWHHRKPNCPPGHSSLPAPVQFPEFSPAIFLLLAGLSLSLITFLTEKLIKHSFPHRLANLKELEKGSLSSIFE